MTMSRSILPLSTASRCSQRVTVCRARSYVGSISAMNSPSRFCASPCVAAASRADFKVLIRPVVYVRASSSCASARSLARTLRDVSQAH